MRGFPLFACALITLSYRPQKERRERCNTLPVGLPERMAADAEPYPDGDQSDELRAGAALFTSIVTDS
jgi:hypothetical protein